MSIERINFDEISEQDLKDLIQFGRPESIGIEYKRQPYDKRDPRNKTEALKDITAFANASGGHLIIGMDEKDGVADEIVPICDIDSDTLINRLSALIHDLVEPRIVGIRMRAVTISGGGFVLVVRIPKSWNPPHRVNADNLNRFFIRDSGGAHEASVEELRVLFTQTSELHERISNFRSERIAKLVAGKGPIPLRDGGRQFIHLIPLSAFGQQSQIDLKQAHEDHMRFRPIESGSGPRYNLDGFINFGGGCEDRSYTQVFRNGILETVRAGILNNYQNMNILHASSTINQITEALPRFLDGLSALEVPAPLVVMISYQDVAGARLAIDRGEHYLHEIRPFPNEDPMLLPEVIIEQYGSRDDYLQTAKPIFDALWNAAGFPNCTFYGQDGTWQPPVR